MTIKPNRRRRIRTLNRHITLILLLLASCTFVGCNLEAEDSVDSDRKKVQSGERDQEERENRARALLEHARGISPVEKIEKLVDVAHVYHDTAAGPQAWQELVFYLLDHSNNDFERAADEMKLFARRCPDSEELLTSCMLQYHATLKPLQANPNLESAARRQELAAEALERWARVGEHICALPAFANNYGAHLETGNALATMGKTTEAERIWAKVEEFKEPARDEHRMDILLKRADLIRSKGGDRKLAKRLYLKVQEFQKTMAKHIPDSHRKWVEDALKELATSSRD